MLIGRIGTIREGRLVILLCSYYTHYWWHSQHLPYLYTVLTTPTCHVGDTHSASHTCTLFLLHPPAMSVTLTMPPVSVHCSYYTHLPCLWHSQCLPNLYTVLTTPTCHVGDTQCLPYLYTVLTTPTWHVGDTHSASCTCTLFLQHPHAMLVTLSAPRTFTLFLQHPHAMLVTLTVPPIPVHCSYNTHMPCRWHSQCLPYHTLFLLYPIAMLATLTVPPVPYMVLSTLTCHVGDTHSASRTIHCSYNTHLPCWRHSQCLLYHIWFFLHSPAMSVTLTAPPEPVHCSYYTHLPCLWHSIPPVPVHSITTLTCHVGETECRGRRVFLRTFRIHNKNPLAIKLLHVTTFKMNIHISLKINLCLSKFHTHSQTHTGKLLKSYWIKRKHLVTN